MIKYIPLIVFSYIVLVIVIFFGTLSHYLSETSRENSMEIAKTYMEALSTVHKYYSTEITPRAEAAGVVFDSHYKRHVDRLPHPGTVAMELGRELERVDPRLNFNLYSRYPFPWAASRKLDSFENLTLDAFAAGQTKGRVGFDRVNGEDVIRYAVPVTMTESCIECHNRPEFGFERVWELGDLRGARQVSLPLHKNDVYQNNIIYFVALFTLIVGGTGMGFVWPLTRKLQNSFMEKSADLIKIQNTEEKLRQAQKLEAVGQLTGGIAHDFNNLLMVIQGNTELYMAEGATDEKLLHAVLEATGNGASLTRMLLAFSRKQPLAACTIDIARTVGKMSELLIRTLGETIAIKYETEPALWRAYADPNQVENALLNIAINARDAMPEGGLLSIQCKNIVLDETYAAGNLDVVAGEYVVLSISDNGIGMTEDELSHAVDPFFTTKEVGRGSGLGLSMIYGFSKQSDGHLEIHSEKNVGTTVNLYLPRSTEKPLANEIVARKGIPHGNNETVLVVEDDPNVRKMARRMLEAINYNILVAENAVAAQKLLSNDNSIDLVLCDVVLTGGVNGPEFVKEAIAGGANFAVVFMSGYPADVYDANTKAMSDSVLLNKPFQIDQLAKAIITQLDRRKQ